MLHAIRNLGALGVVEALHCAHQVAGNPANALKPDAIADYAVNNRQL